MHPDFKLPSIGRVSGRTSSITSAFFQAITPVVSPTYDEVEQALSILGMTRGKCTCAYCGAIHSEWDHFRPIVIDRKPTGYITEIANLVPSCGKCNQSKGNKNWKEWMQGSAKLSPNSRGVDNLDERIKYLERYEDWRKPTCVNYQQLVGPERWSDYMNLLDSAVSHLSKAQKVASELHGLIANELGKQQSQ